MTSLDISQADYAKQLIQILEQDKTFNIELKEASNVFLEKSWKRIMILRKKVSVAAYLIVLFFIFLNPGNRMLVYLLKMSEVVHLKQIIQLLRHKKHLLYNDAYLPSAELQIFSMKEIQDIKAIYLKLFIKTAEKYFTYLDPSLP